MNNTLILPGVSNARELGGYPVGGRCVRKGVLIRSGALAHAQSEAIQTLRETYHIQAVVDFRMRDKRSGAPDPEIPGVENTSLPVVEMEDYMARLGGKDMSRLSQVKDKKLIFEMAYEYGMLGPELYTVFLLGERGINAYRRFFEILLRTDPDKGAVLWHCDDGKDRAGIAAMLLLSALGADRETVLQDYLLTNESNAHVIEAIKREYASYNMPEDKLNAMIFASGGVFAYYLDHAFDALDAHYGGVTGYLQAALGLTDADLDALRKKYLA